MARPSPRLAPVINARRLSKRNWSRAPTAQPPGRTSGCCCRRRRLRRAGAEEGRERGDLGSAGGAKRSRFWATPGRWWATGEGDSRLGRCWASLGERAMGDWGDQPASGRRWAMVGDGRTGDPQNLDLLAPPCADAHWAVGPTPRTDKGGTTAAPVVLCTLGESRVRTGLSGGTVTKPSKWAKVFWGLGPSHLLVLLGALFSIARLVPSHTFF